MDEYRKQELRDNKTVIKICFLLITCFYGCMHVINFFIMILEPSNPKIYLYFISYTRTFIEVDLC